MSQYLRDEIEAAGVGVRLSTIIVGAEGDGRLRELTLLNTTSMPSFQGKFTANEMTDLITYLLSLKGE